MRITTSDLTPFIHRIIPLLLVIFAIVFSTSLVNIQYRSDIADYFGENEPAIFDYAELTEHFSNQDSLLLIVSLLNSAPNTQSQEPPHTSIIGLDTLQIFQNFVVKIQSSQNIRSINTLLDATVTIDSKEGQQTLPLSEVLNHYDQPNTFHPVASQIQDSLQGRSFFLSTDKRSTIIEIQFTDTTPSIQTYQHVVTQLQQLAEATHTFTLHPWGDLAVKSALQDALVHDGVVLFPIILLSGIVLLYLFIGSPRLIFAGVLTIIFALLLTLELAGITRTVFNQTSILAFGIVFIISLADIIHVLMCYQTQSDPSSRQAITAAIEKKRLPLCLTTLTTGIGFLSLAFSGSPTFATFGLIAAGGVFFALITTLYILPIIITLLVGQRHSTTLTQPSPPALSLLNKLLRRIINRLHLAQRTPVLLLVGATAFLSIGIVFTTFHNDALTYFHKDSAIGQSVTQFERAFDTHQGLAVMLTPPTQDAIYDPNTMHLVRSFHHWLDEQSWANIHSSYIHTLENIHRGLHENDVRWQQLPNDEAHIAELFSLYEMASDNNQLSHLGIHAASGAILISVGIPDMLNQEVLQVQRDITQWFYLNSPATTVTVSGQAILFANVGWNLTQDMLIGAGLTLAVITGLIGVAFRNPRLAVLSLLPNLLPALVSVGCVGWLYGKINFAIAGSISMALGIVVDDTIHILSEYRKHRQQGTPPQRSIDTTIRDTGPALLLTTLVLSVGFSVLNFALFVPNQHTAQMITAMVSSAIIYDFLLLPYILIKSDSLLFPKHYAPHTLVPRSLP